MTIQFRRNSEWDIHNLDVFSVATRIHVGMLKTTIRVSKYLNKIIIKSIQNFKNQKIDVANQVQTKGGLTSQTNDASDLQVGNTVYTNLLDGTIKNNDKIKFEK